MLPSVMKHTLLLTLTPSQWISPCESLTIRQRPKNVCNDRAYAGSGSVLLHWTGRYALFLFHGLSHDRAARFRTVSSFDSEMPAAVGYWHAIP
jgi:hypothetical protein